MPRGGWNRKTDDERKANGTWRPGTSSEARERRLSENIFAGPGFIDVPDPEMPLGGFGQRKYFELCGRLLREARLTATTRSTVEQAAILLEAQYLRMSTGDRVPAYLTRDIARLLGTLKLAEDTTPIAGNVASARPENPFAVCGALLAPFAPRGLRGAAAASA